MNKLDLLREDAIRSSLSFNLKGLPLFVYDEIDSTNNEAKRNVIDKNLGHALYVADKQTAGRGRSGRSFYSPSSTGVYFTYAFTPAEGIAAATHVTTKAGVCVSRAIEELYGVTPSIKWVNDIYVGQRKVCGILAEAVTSSTLNMGTIVVGIGINICTEEFPDDITNRAGSISDDTSVSRNELVARIISYLDEEIQKLCDVSYLEYFRSHSMLTGYDITYLEGEVAKEATVIGIDDEAGLIVRDFAGNEFVLRNGEVNTIRKKD